MSVHIQKVQIDSRLRKFGSISSFEVELPNRGLLGRYELKAVNVFNSYTNINSTNNQVGYTANSVSGVVQLPSGSYTIVQLATALKTNLDLATSLTWSVSFSSVTFKMTFATTGAFVLDFSVAKSLGFGLGFEEQIYSSVSNALTGVKQVGLSTQPMNYFISLREANDEMTLLNASSTTFIVPILSSLNALNYYEPTRNSRQTTSFSTETKRLHVSIYDHLHRLVDFQSDWYMLLEHLGY
jgi:hypothetical protein